jgi:hypothetical protein
LANSAIFRCAPSFHTASGRSCRSLHFQTGFEAAESVGSNFELDQSKSAIKDINCHGCTKAEGSMVTKALRWIAVFISCSLLAGGIASDSLADPATASSERVAKYGSWSVVKKPSTYIKLNDAGELIEKGRHFICSAALFASNASLELQATNDEAWSIYVAAKGWNYRHGLKTLTIKSGSQEIRISQALYDGSMISAMSHYIFGERPVPIETLKSLISLSQPISIHDNTGRKLVTFPNSGEDLVRAFNRAIDCTLASLS